MFRAKSSFVADNKFQKQIGATIKQVSTRFYYNGLSCSNFAMI